MPHEPDSFIERQTYGFGDPVGARDARAWRSAEKLLRPDFGTLRHGIRELPTSVAPEAVKRELDRQLSSDGWEPVAALDDFDPTQQSYAFGWSNHGRVYAIVGLAHEPAKRERSPVNILTNIQGDGTYVAQSEGRS